MNVVEADEMVKIRHGFVSVVKKRWWFWLEIANKANPLLIGLSQIRTKYCESTHFHENMNGPPQKVIASVISVCSPRQHILWSMAKPLVSRSYDREWRRKSWQAVMLLNFTKPELLQRCAIKPKYFVLQFKKNQLVEGDIKHALFAMTWYVAA